MGYIIKGITNVFNFSGSSDRTEFWVYVIAVFVVLWLLGRFALGVFSWTGSILTGRSLLWAVIYVILFAAICCRRLHHIGWPGILTILCMFPLFGLIVGLIPGKSSR
ncbi:MAG: DUF805 domain-containing protein [Deltaproteobacteria bacterium]|jgi:uncharacterized membrane protein YhaH (DUF805 family)|nr:DUF805 domain-containing protein [Deltaproteobacteria bacterium]